MQTRRRFWVVFSCLVFALLAVQSPASFIHNVRAASSPQTAQGTLSLTDTLSGGLWARLNSVVNGTSIIDPSKNPTALGPPSLSAAAPPDPPNLFTNNIRVTGNNGLFPLEDEPSIAVTNQSGHVLMVVGANSLSTGLMPAYVSRDQGSTWLGPAYLQLSRTNDSFASDPGLAVDRSGKFYYSFLSIGNTFFFGSRTGEDDLVVATSTDGGNWTNHIAVQRRTFVNSTISTINDELYDKPYISVGPSPTNSLTDAIYVTYTDFVDFYRNICTPTCYGSSENSTIMEVHSIDGGSTWSAPRAVSPTVTISSNFGPTTGRLVQGSMPAVDPSNGGLYVAYYDTNSSGWLTGNATVMVAKSTDGGVTFSKPVLAGFIPQQVTYYSSSCQGYYCGPGFRWWSTMFPSMDVARDGTVYISYGAKQSKGSADPADIFLVASTNGGITWTPRVRVNDASSQNGAFFSWLKVSGDGVVHIIWGDRRLDPAQIGYDIYYAQATNLGQTIGTNIRVTDIGTDPINTVGFVGDYFGMAVSGGQVYPVWTDGRRGIRPLGQYLLQGETDIFTAKLGSRATPTITVGQGAPAGYYAPVTISGTGLPRDAYFALKMNYIPLTSPTYTYPLFFSDSTGNLNVAVTPNANYYGSYPVELDEWLTGTPIASTSMYIVDSRGLQVLVAGPSTAHPGDTFTWDIQLITPSGTTNPQGYDSTISITAQLMYPNGTIRDVTSSAQATSPTSYLLTTKLSTSAATGSYVLIITGSQTGPTVQSTGIGTASFTVDQNPQNSSNPPLQVIVVGPSTAHPGDTFTWDIQLITPSGTVNAQGYGSTITINAQLMYSNGTIRDVTSSAKSTSPTSYSLTTNLSTNAPTGPYVLIITASQTGPTVQSIGVGTASFTVAPNNPQNSSSLSLQVLVTGPSTVHPGDTFTWYIQVITPSGTVNPQGYGSTLSLNAQLMYPNGTIRDVTSSAQSTGSTSYSLTTKLSTTAPTGSYVLIITGSQTGQTVQSNGTGTASFTVDQNNPQNTSNLPQDNSLMFGIIAGGIGVIGAVSGAMVVFLSTRRKQSPHAIPSP